MSNRIQEWFTTMVIGMAAQQWERAVRLDNGMNGTCLYRAEYGKKCAIGQIIPDDARVITIGEGISSLTSDKMWYLGLGTISPQERRFLEDAQRAHDMAKTPEEVRKEFLKIQRYYKLDWPADIATQ